MKIAHIAIATPGRCGLYETTRELVAAERKLGIDARIVDPKPNPELSPKGPEDRGALLADMDWAKTADIIANHSGFDGTPVASTNQPVIHFAHGRPLASFKSQREGKGAPVLAYSINQSKKPRFKAVVTFWAEHADFLKVVWGNVPVHTIPAPVDLEAWVPGKKKYDFHKNEGSPNVVITDPWRSDVDPFLAINAYALFAREFKGAKLHIYGANGNRKGFDALFALLKTEGTLGEVCGWAQGLDHVYRAADLMITPHKINTRSIREAMASGCRVVTGKDVDPENIQEFAEAMGKKLVAKESNERAMAEKLFNPQVSAQKFISIAQEIVDGN